MGKEIERKFLVLNDQYRKSAIRSVHITQAYISTDPNATVRVRIMDSKAFITIKGITSNATRDEWEYEIPCHDAKEIMDRCAKTPIIDKTRYYYNGWEIDEFHGHLEGLTVAEIELDTPESQFDKPSFIGREVTDDKCYYNSVLSISKECPPTR